MHKEVIEKALSLFEEILDSLQNLAEVQTSRLKLIEAYKEVTFTANLLTPTLVGEQPAVERARKLKERVERSLEVVDDYCRALANINQTDFELWSIKKDHSVKKIF